MFASNAGANIANGKYIARMDADDWAFPERLKLQIDFLQKNTDYQAVSGLVEHVPHNENTGGLARYVKWNNSIQDFKDIVNRQFIEMPLVNPSTMWQKEFSEKHGLYKAGDFPEDYEMWLRWLSKGLKIYKLPAKVLKWYDSDTRLTRTDPIYSDKAFYKIKTQYLAAWLKQKNPFFPNVAIWGASRISRRRAKMLEKHKISISCYIDTKHGRLLDKKVIYYKDIPPPGEFFILTYIKQMDAREEIVAFLNDKGYQEGLNYLLVS